MTEPARAKHLSCGLESKQELFTLRLDASRRATSPAFPRVFETKRRAPRGRKNKVRPLMMHNIGGGQVLEDVLFGYQITGHFRYGVD